MENLSDIAVFVQVIDRGSFTAAAEQLQLSKSVISKYVSRLEEQLGVRLLHRTTRRLSLTEAGQILYQRSQRGLEEIEAAEMEVSQLQQTPRGRLRFNCPMSFGILHIASALSEFRTEYPEVSIDMSMEDRTIDLVDEGYDLAIRIGELPDSSLVARRLAPCKHVLCASPAYLKDHGTPRTPEDLRKHETLTYGYHDSPREWRLHAPDGRYINVPVNSTMHMNNSLALREAVLTGAGIMLTPTFIVGPDIQAGRLQQLLPNYRMLELSIYVVYPERKHLSPKVRAFVEFMLKRMSDTPYWDK